jgi:hypothetical protein
MLSFEKRKSEGVPNVTSFLCEGKDKVLCSEEEGWD